MPEFKSWSEIDKFQGIHVVITEKLHGSNGVILVYEEEGSLKAVGGSRTRFLDPINGKDNFGFGAYVMAHEAEICEKLGPGYHYGEVVGPGVNSSYGLTEKVFVLFDYKRHPAEKERAGQLPPRMRTIPVLYNGPYSQEVVANALADLRLNGSKFVPGFSSPEGIVLHFPQFGTRKKLVFTPEETGWIKKGKPKDPNAVKVDYLEVARPYLQPIRLEKLMMKEESYKLGFPDNLPIIVKAYLEDLTKETSGLTEEQIKAIKKTAYPFVKEEIERMLGSDLL